MSLSQTFWARKRATCTGNFSKYVLYIIKVAFPISDEQPSFLPKLSKARYRAPLIAAVGAVRKSYFQPLPPQSHLSHFASHFTSRLILWSQQFTNILRNDRNVGASQYIQASWNIDKKKYCFCLVFHKKYRRLHWEFSFSRESRFIEDGAFVLWRPPRPFRVKSAREAPSIGNTHRSQERALPNRLLSHPWPLHGFNWVALLSYLDDFDIAVFELRLLHPFCWRWHGLAEVGSGTTLSSGNGQAKEKKLSVCRLNDGREERPADACSG